MTDAIGASRAYERCSEGLRVLCLLNHFEPHSAPCGCTCAAVLRAFVHSRANTKGSRRTMTTCWSPPRGLPAGSSSATSDPTCRRRRCDRPCSLVPTTPSRTSAKPAGANQGCSNAQPDRLDRWSLSGPCDASARRSRRKMQRSSAGVSPPRVTSRCRARVPHHNGSGAPGRAVDLLARWTRAVRAFRVRAD